MDQFLIVVFMMLALSLIAVILWSINIYSFLEGDWEIITLDYIKFIIALFGLGISLMYLIHRRK